MEGVRTHLAAVVAGDDDAVLGASGQGDDQLRVEEEVVLPGAGAAGVAAIFDVDDAGSDVGDVVRDGDAVVAIGGGREREHHIRLHPIDAGIVAGVRVGAVGELGVIDGEVRRRGANHDRRGAVLTGLNGVDALRLVSGANRAVRTPVSAGPTAAVVATDQALADRGADRLDVHHV